MKILFVHQNFPGQYLHLARHFGSQAGHQAVFITQRKDCELPGVRKLVYKPRRTITPQVHHYLRESEAAVLNAQEVARVALDLRKAGFVPDVMLGHNGWGEIWYLKDIFPEGESYKKKLLAELGDSLDLSRVHFLGKVPYNAFIKVLQVSSVHVYLTYPFVLSWSMLEAMSAECLIVGSRTQPVEEVIHHGGNGLLVDFFSPDEIAARVIDALEDPRAFTSIRKNARQTVLNQYDLHSLCLPAHLRLLNTLVPREQRLYVQPVKGTEPPVRLAG